MESKNFGLLEIARTQIKNACDKLELDSSVYEVLKSPMRVLEVSFPVRMDD